MQINKDILTRIRDKYPKGARVELLAMDDPHAPSTYTKGTVKYVDDNATVHVLWDSGSTLGVVYGVDIIRLI